MQCDTSSRAHLERVHLEDDVGFLDASLYGLTTVVEVKPGWQGERLTVVTVGEKSTVLQSVGSVETLQGHSQRVGAIADALLAPGGHLCVLAHSRPPGIGLHHGLELGCHLGIVGLGVDDVAHLSQPGDVGAGAEASIYTQDDGHRVGITCVVGLQLRQVRGQCGLLSPQAFQSLPMGCCCPLRFLQVLRRFLELLLSCCQTATCLGQLTVGLFLPALCTVGGFQTSHLGFQPSHLFGQRL